MVRAASSSQTLRKVSNSCFVVVLPLSVLARTCGSRAVASRRPNTNPLETRTLFSLADRSCQARTHGVRPPKIRLLVAARLIPALPFLACLTAVGNAKQSVSTEGF